MPPVLFCGRRFMINISVWWFAYTILNIAIPTVILPDQFQHITTDGERTMPHAISCDTVARASRARGEALPTTPSNSQLMKQATPA